MASGHRDTSNGLYSFHQNISAQTATIDSISDLWHCRFGHLSYQSLHHLSHHSRVIGLSQVQSPSRVCEHCLTGRQQRRKFSKASFTRATKPSEILHSDLMGPLSTPTLAGSRYILVFTDDYSHKSWIYFLKSKDQTFFFFRTFMAKIRTETGNPLSILHTNRGGEYLSHEFTTFCDENGIQRHLTQAHTSQQNGVAERRNRTIMERDCNLSTHCNLPLFLWSEAVSTANYLINRSPICANAGITPKERYNGQKSSVEHLRIFGCFAFRHIPIEHRKKLDSKSSKCLFLGYDTNSKAFKVYDAQKRKVLITRDLVFDETRIGLSHLTNDEPPLQDTFLLGSPFVSHKSFDLQESSQDEIMPPLQPNSPQLAPLQNTSPSLASSSPTTHTSHVLPFPNLDSHDPSSSPPAPGQQPTQRRYPTRK